MDPPYRRFLSEGILMFAKKSVSFGIAFFSILTMFSFPGFAPAQGILPAEEQEFTDAKVAIEAAQRAKAEKYAPEPLKQARDLLIVAGKARTSQDSVKFTQASRPRVCWAGQSNGRSQNRGREIGRDL
jgi:hypothetical protein